MKNKLKKLGYKEVSNRVFVKETSYHHKVVVELYDKKDIIKYHCCCVNEEVTNSILAEKKSDEEKLANGMKLRELGYKRGIDIEKLGYKPDYFVNKNKYIKDMGLYLLVYRDKKITARILGYGEAFKQYNNDLFNVFHEHSILEHEKESLKYVLSGKAKETIRSIRDGKCKARKGTELHVYVSKVKSVDEKSVYERVFYFDNKNNLRLATGPGGVEHYMGNGKVKVDPFLSEIDYKLEGVRKIAERANKPIIE